MIWVAGLLLLLTYAAFKGGQSGQGWVYLLLAGGLLWWRSRRRRSYPAARSKAHGASRDLLRSAQVKERELLSPELEVLSDGSTQERSKWERVCSDAGLSGATLQRIEATPTGWLYQVELRSGGTLEQVQSAKGALESALDERRGAITLEQGERARVVLLKIQERAPDTAPLSWPGPPRDASIYDDVQLGAYVDHDGGPLRHPLAYQHVVIAGASGSGKSVVLNAEVAHVAACRDAVMVGCDLKGGVELGPWEPLMVRVATTRPEAEELLEWVAAMIEYRGPILKRRGLRKWQFTPQEPALVVFIDEHARLSYSKRVKDALEQIVEQGRAVGIILVTCLQKPTKGALGSDRIGPNLTVRVCLRVANTNEVGVALWPGAVSDGWAADEISKGQPGTLYLHGPDAEHPRLARAFHVTDAQVERAVRFLRGRPRPTLGTARPAPVPLSTPPARSVPADHTQSDEPVGSGGGEAGLILDQLPATLDQLAAYFDPKPSRTTIYRRLVKLRDEHGRVEHADGVWRLVP